MAISEILERVNKGRRKRTYPRVIKKYIGRSYPVKQPGQAGGAYDPVISIRHPLTEPFSSSDLAGLKDVDGFG